MASFKLVVALLAVSAFVAAAEAAAVASERDQTVIFGKAGPYDKILYSEKVDVPSTILQVHNRDVRYPPHSSVPAYKINAIKVLDLLKTGKNAYVSITSGGVGTKEAVVHLKSKRGKHIRYMIEFWGA